MSTNIQGIVGRPLRKFCCCTRHESPIPTFTFVLSFTLAAATQQMGACIWLRSMPDMHTDPAYSFVPRTVLVRRFIHF